MKKTKKLSYKSLLLIFAVFSTSHTTFGQTLLGGTLQFAKNAPLNGISICHCGKKIITQNHETTIPKITYEIPKSSDQSVFYVLVCSQELVGSVKQFPSQEEDQNTIEYLKINSDVPYLLYKLTLIQDTEVGLDGKKQVVYRWDITQELLPETGQVPDTAIILTYFPSFIKAIKGGNQLELPTIYIDNSVISSFGSEENFEDALIELQLSSLNLNALHSPAKRKTKSDSCRLLVMDALT